VQPSIEQRHRFAAHATFSPISSTLEPAGHLGHAVRNRQRRQRGVATLPILMSSMRRASLCGDSGVTKRRFDFRLVIPRSQVLIRLSDSLTFNRAMRGFLCFPTCMHVSWSGASGRSGVNDQGDWRQMLPCDWAFVCFKNSRQSEQVVLRATRDVLAANALWRTQRRINCSLEIALRRQEVFSVLDTVAETLGQDY
jgi:hypothetical protein